MYGEKERHDDFYWFIEHYNELYNEYGVSYIAIQHQKILGVYHDFGAAIRETQKYCKIGTFCVQYCNGDESGYTCSVATNFI